MNYQRITKIIFISSTILFLSSLIFGLKYGFRKESKTPLAYFPLKAVAEGSPKFITISQVSAIFAYSFGLISFEKRIKEKVNLEIFKWILIVSLVVCILMMYEILLRFSFWGPYALETTEINLSSTKDHKKIDNLKMGGFYFVNSTKNNSTFFAIGLFTLLWSYKILIKNPS